MERKTFRLTLSCPNQAGIVAAITTEMFGLSANIVEAHQFDDAETDRFFARIMFNTPADVTKNAIVTALSPHAERYKFEWNVWDTSALPKVLVLVSRFDHCLVDLLYRWRIGELPMNLVGVVSNHPLEALPRVDMGDVPFHHFPITKQTKLEQEARIRKLVEDHAIDLVVLARYMQILSDEMARFLSSRCINIHHSFLPSFKGARPYHQAHARGVKLIGATAHYVTADLDEGPIIEQAVERVSHSDRPDDLVRKGRDIERQVLTAAVAAHLDGRVLPNGNKTVVFRG